MGPVFESRPPCLPAFFLLTNEAIAFASLALIYTPTGANGHTNVQLLGY